MTKKMEGIKYKNNDGKRRTKPAKNERQRNKRKTNKLKKK